MTEYHIQKRGMKVWQYVTWYDSYEQAKRNFDTLVKAQGWSYRIVSLEVMDEALLDGEYKDEVDGDIVGTVDHTTPAIYKSLPEPTGEFKSDWGTPQASWASKPTSEAPIKPEHGLTGSVWVGNPVTKEKKRVVGFEANRMLTEGWVRCGPRTEL